VPMLMTLIMLMTINNNDDDDDNAKVKGNDNTYANDRKTGWEET
jgi:hypothetical protein